MNTFIVICLVLTFWRELYLFKMASDTRKKMIVECGDKKEDVFLFDAILSLFIFPSLSVMVFVVFVLIGWR